MNILLLPNAFKGVFSSKKVCEMISEVISKANCNTEVSFLPFSDGGDSTLDSYRFLYQEKAQEIHLNVCGPDSQQIVESEYLLTEDKTAIIESAKACGFAISKKKYALLATTYGLGQMIINALDHQAKEIIVGLGGSATNDLGCGMLSSLGVSFFDENKNSFIPNASTLIKVSSIDISKLDKRLKKTKLTILTDVTNPLLGPKGATYIFGHQKGISAAMLPEIEKGMTHVSSLITNLISADYTRNSGAGAAGGLGFAFISLLNAKSESGSKTLLRQEKLQKLITEAEMIITGEGKLDNQTLSGKGVHTICEEIRKNNPDKKLVILYGIAEKETLDYFHKQFNAIMIDVSSSDISSKPISETDFKTKLLFFLRNELIIAN